MRNSALSAIGRPIRHVARGNVRREGSVRALLRITVPAAARGAERDSLALLDDVLLLGIVLHAVDLEFAGRAIPAAFDAEGREDRALGEERDGDRRVAPAF